MHRKALAKVEAQRQRDLQLGASRGAAESALVCTIPGSTVVSSSQSLTVHPLSHCAFMPAISCEVGSPGRSCCSGCVWDL